MTTAATITANLILNSSQYQQGMKAAGAATDRMKGKVSSLTSFVQRNAVMIENLGKRFQDAGKKMTAFVTLPILGFFALLIKKAMDADTALGKLAKESTARLNTSLAQLGEKFLPIFIKTIDWLTKMIDKFNSASPAMQNFILFLVGMIALAGPLMSFGGTILTVISTLSAIGPALGTLTPMVATFGTTLWAALVPILPIVIAIIALIAGLSFVIWAFATDFMGVTTALKQLFWIIGYEFKKMWADMKAGMSEGLDNFKQSTQKSIDVWKNNWKQAQEIQTKLFKLTMTTMHTAVMDFVMKASMKFNEFRNNVMSVVNYIGSIFYSVFSSIGSFVNSIIIGIINGINILIEAINQLGFALNTLEIPPELTPGSPTPFEIGLLGISKAMALLAKKSIPKMNVGLAPDNALGIGGGRKEIRITDNRRFAAGLDAKTLRTALDSHFEGLAAALEEI